MAENFSPPIYALGQMTKMPRILLFGYKPTQGQTVHLFTDAPNAHAAFMTLLCLDTSFAMALRALHHRYRPTPPVWRSKLGNLLSQCVPPEFLGSLNPSLLVSILHYPWSIVMYLSLNLHRISLAIRSRPAPAHHNHGRHHFHNMLSITHHLRVTTIGPQSPP
jgi:hypothetical protein